MNLKGLKKGKEYQRAGEKLRLNLAVSSLIFESRLLKKVTQKELAERIGTQQTSIARIERGLSLPSLRFLDKIAKGLGTRVEVTFEGFEKEKNAYIQSVEEVQFIVPSNYTIFSSVDESYTPIPVDLEK